MKLIIGGKEIALDDKEVILTRKAVNAFFDSMRAGAAKINTPTVYLTAVIVAYVKTKGILESITPEALQMLMDLAIQRESEG